MGIATTSKSQFRILVTICSGAVQGKRSRHPTFHLRRGMAHHQNLHVVLDHNAQEGSPKSFQIFAYAFRPMMVKPELVLKIWIALNWVANCLDGLMIKFSA